MSKIAEGIQVHDIERFTADLARNAGELIVREREAADLVHSFKHGNELVTSADLKADEIICAHIKSAFPDHEIVSEESAPDTDRAEILSSPVWIIDPIDGTVNYAHGHNQSAVSIAFR